MVTTTLSLKGLKAGHGQQQKEGYGHQHNNIMRDLVRLVSSENNISFTRMVKKVEYTGLVSIVMATLTTIQPFLLIRIFSEVSFRD